MGDRTDAELLGAIQSGRRDAWEVLVHRHTGRLWAIARAQGLDRDQASDTVQTVWAVLVNDMHKIRTPDALAGWLGQVARHEAIRRSRRAVRELGHETERLERLTKEHEPAADVLLVAADRASEVRRGLAQLGPACRELLGLLFSDEDLSYTDVSEILGMPVGSIGPTRARCLAHLKRLLEP